MPREITIVKKEIVTPIDRNENTYGDILFHDKAGKEYKISNKRAHLGSEIVEGQAVELGYGNYMNRDYIAEARLVSDNLPPPIKSHIPDEKKAAEMCKEVETQKPINPQEIGLWFKEVGEMIRAGMLKSKNADGTPNLRNHALQLVYFNRMCEVLGVHEK